ncbi:hypothetical protein LZC95_49475 [Pendulispora brunnea]|uniref:Uncharacterized protein n=1 Tax=Pendulispora brunnea TaxID=2905690 RepID=A0ABZ2K700_9BACT
MMPTREKVLYHQIHPAKLAVDFSTSFASTWLGWQHELWTGLLVAFGPSVVVTMAMLRWMDFSKQRDSSFGHYVAFHMTPGATAVRSGGQLVMWMGAWLHLVWAIPAGFIVILLGWTYSLPSWYARQKP